MGEIIEVVGMAEPGSSQHQDIAPSRTHSQSHFGDLWRPLSISAAKRGGAASGIGEKFSAIPVTDTGTITLPFATSPGHPRLGPRLNLTCNSASGRINGQPAQTLKERTGSITNVAWSADGCLASSGLDDTINILDLNTQLSLEEACNG